MGAKKQGFIAGLTSIFYGWRLLWKEPTLKRIALIPIIIDTILFVVLLSAFVYWFDDLRNLVWTEPQITVWYHYLLLVLWWLFNVVFAVLGGVVVLLLIVIFGNIVAAPFNDALAGRTWRIISGQDTPEGSGGIIVLIKETFATIGEELKKVLLFILLQIPAVFLWLIPGVGSFLSTVWGLLVSWWFFALEFLDYPLARLKLSFSEKRAWVNKHLSASMGFGIGASVLMFVPLLNLALLPVCVVAATLLVWNAEGT